MLKHYLFRSTQPIYKEFFESALDGLEREYEIEYLDDKSGEILSDERFYVDLDKLMPTIHDDLNITMSFLCCHDRGQFMSRLADEALAYFPNLCLFPSDVIMKEMSFGDYRSLAPLKAMFSKVEHELLLTAATYLRCGCDACLASERLFIHRNTFNYRLAKFMDATGLDIRDYHNALLLELFFQLC